MLKRAQLAGFEGLVRRWRLSRANGAPMNRHRLPSLVLAATLLTAGAAQAQLSGLLKDAKKQLGAAAPTTSRAPSGAAQASQSTTAFQGGGANSIGEMVLTKKRPASFAAAKSSAATEFNDGDDVWLAMHLNQPIKTYAGKETKAGAVEYYTVHFDLKRDGLKSAFATCEWYLTPQEGEGTDLILSFSPVSAREMPSGSFSLEAKTTCLLKAIADDGSDAGRWNFRVGLLKVEGEMIRADKAIVTAPFVANVPNGYPLWNKIYRNAGGACDPRTQAKGSAVILCKK